MVHQEIHPVICMHWEEFGSPPPQVKPAAAAEADILQQILNEWMNENNVIALIMTTIAHVNSFILQKYRHHFLAG